MKITEEFAFHAHYVIDVAPGWPEGNEAVVRGLAAKSSFVRSTGDFLNLRFYPNHGPSWFGEFEVSEQNNGGGICSTSDPDVAFVRSGWQVYRVNVTKKSVDPLSTFPVTQMKSDPHRKLIWLVSFDHIESINSEGDLQWKSERLFYDNLRVLDVNEKTTLVEGFDGGSIVSLELNLEDGRIVDQLLHG